MHVLYLVLKIAVQTAIVVFVPGGGIIVILNLYRKYRASKNKLAASGTATPQPAVSPNN